MRWNAVLIAAALGLAGAKAQDPASARTDNVEARLIAETNGVQPGGTVSVALRLAIREHWHTYWSYAGDSGEATAIDWTLPKGVTAGVLQFPYAHRIEVGPLVNFGYEGTVLHLTDIAVPASAKPGETISLKADATWLVCEEICIPEEARLTLDIPVVAEAPPIDAAYKAEFDATRAKLTRPSPWPATFAVGNGRVAVSLEAPELAKAGLSEAVLFPAKGGYIKNAAKQSVETANGRVTVATESGRHFSTPDKTAEHTTMPVVFVLTGSDGQTQAFAADATLSPSGAAGGVSSAVGGGEPLSIWTAIAFAFLGGLILNLMPCVFPVLSMKALALAKKGGDPGKARIGGFAYTAGVVISFVGMAGALIALREGGEAVGWGFQLQSPVVVAALALLFFVIGLNLMGVFEVGMRLQNVGASAGKGDGVGGSFMTGVLAAVVAAPCTAPFMAGAIGTALSQPAAVALAIFASLGLGMAAPYLLLTLSPALVRRMPKPGLWMERLKQVLAFPMFGSAVWLLWVLTIQAGPNALVFVLGSFVLAGFALWLWGLAQRGEGGWFARGTAGLAAAAVVAAVATVSGPAAATDGLAHEPYSAARLKELTSEGRTVFINLTAAWCVTCLVNEEVALSGQALAEAFKSANVAYLKGDWTNRDPAITALLEQHGRAGVPLYLVYRPGQATPDILPQILTEGIVIDAIQPGAQTASKE